ncbi:hypothetical protein OUZ56_033042 [Daphnia magna]|uniref:Uncharacterized protein n=1 Tax=Daphnia magna TaxID=35525 RepID=A0ABR0BAF2_9CRUS|nr:hypothetical protein OUZ56_033042 [Daphnia magna]
MARWSTGYSTAASEVCPSFIQQNRESNLNSNEVRRVQKYKCVAVGVNYRVFWSSNGPKIVLDGDFGLGLSRLNEILVVRGIKVNQSTFAYLDGVPMPVA